MFKLDPAQQEKLDAWLEGQNDRLVAEQENNPELAHFIVSVNGKKQAYTGAIGGALTYQFTPTGVGTVVSAVFCMGTKYEAKIDLTDYASW